MNKPFRVPLAGAYNTRTATSNVIGAASGVWGVGVWGTFIWGANSTGTNRDQFFLNCYAETVPDPITGRKKVYNAKRPGVATHTTPEAGSIGNQILIWTGQGTGDKVISAFGPTNSNIYDGTTALGAITGKATGIAESDVGNDARLVISSSDNTGWNTSGTAVTGAVTFTGDTHTNTTVDNISSTAGLVVGQILTGTGFAANTRIASIDSATALTTNLATTATNAGVTITRTILGKIIDADFPGNAGKTLAGGFCCLDGFAIISTTDGGLWASDLNTLTGWTANSFDTSNAYPDKGIAALRHGTYILHFGTESIQWYINAGLTPFPLQKVPHLTKKIGAVSANAIAQISDVTFWCGSTPQGGLSIFNYDGNISRVSPPELDALLVLAGSSNISLSTLRYFGRSFVFVRASTATFAYVVEEKTWYEVASSIPWWHKCTGLSVGSSNVTYSISTTLTSGKVYKIDPAAPVFTDDGTTYARTIQLAPMDMGTPRMKFWGESEGIDLIADQETNTAPVTIAYSDDDGQSYSVLGTVDLANVRKHITRAGASRRRLWVISESNALPCRLEALAGAAGIGQT
jgi:hypothetical protein